MHGLWIFLTSAEFAFARNFFYTLCGATALYLFSLAKGFKGSTPVLRRLLPSRSDVFYDRLDFFVVIVFGSIIGSVFFVPSNPPQALAAGFGWIAAVNVLSSPGQPHRGPQTADGGSDVGDPK